MAVTRRQLRDVNHRSSRRLRSRVVPRSLATIEALIQNSQQAETKGNDKHGLELKTQICEMEATVGIERNEM
jgi:hypothetical protein